MTSHAAEPPIDPDLEIVDPHHHVWTDFDPPYTWDDFTCDVVHSGHRVTRSIFVECGWLWESERQKPGGVGRAEIEAAARLGRTGSRQTQLALSGLVGFVDLRGEELVAEDIRILRESAEPNRLVGIRHGTAWHHSHLVPQHRTTPGQGLVASASFQRGMARVSEANLPLDLWMYHTQLPDAVDAARRLGDLKLVLDHMGGPLSAGPHQGRWREVDAVWRRDMCQLAELPNVYVKLSGIGMECLAAMPAGTGLPTSTTLAAHWSERVLWCISTFGVERCMFASNFPMDKWSCSYGSLWNAYKRIIEGFSIDEKSCLLAGTAREVYSI